MLTVKHWSTTLQTLIVGVFIVVVCWRSWRLHCSGEVEVPSGDWPCSRYEDCGWLSSFLHVLNDM